ncbi:putative cysteine protease atg4 protein [Eutypa lata UCREL1]|uniref:Cysteine protease n=1 Tax=Eutypa lata (strain UCR-EL1) TaxID=1287681 RepID=M7SYD7_EUTLA|nr:putative cysteine protease atg4 protein [Eutypa lata UCREL1]
METTVDIGRRLVQMFWDPEPSNDIVRDQPVWCLGSSYRLNSNPNTKPETSSSPEAALSKESLPSHAETLPETPPESASTSLDSSLAYEEAPLDGGWPPAFLDDFESRIWMTYRSEFEPIAKSPDPKALAALSFSMRLKTQLSDQNGFSSDRDGPDVYEDNFMKIAKPDGITFYPTLILVGTRLGIDKITPVYWEALVASLQMPQSIGIAGGRPSSSHYFIGVQGLYFFYLDPHYTRPALSYHQNAGEYSQEEIDTCHTRKLRRLHVREMDPSMLIGFFIRDEDDWKDWRRGVKHVQGKAIIHVSDHDPVAQFGEHGGAIDQVETLSDEDEDERGSGSEDDERGVISDE